MGIHVLKVNFKRDFTPYRTMQDNKLKTRMAMRIHAALANRYPLSKTVLECRNPWQLLVATQLAAQCTDERVNTVTPELFRRWPGPAELATVSREELENVIRPTGFFHNKAKNLIACAAMLMENFDGIMPQTMAELIKLPGVARKTANVILFAAFGINEGIAVDTHVRRISYRLGLTDSRDPVIIEQHLMPLFPQKEWGNLNLRLVAYGREICKARKPLCEKCDFSEICPKLEPDQK